MFPSTLDIMQPMHQQSLILLHPTVKEKMHLQEKTYKMLPSTLYIMLPIQLQSLKLLHPKIEDEMHLQENSIFDL